jgi:hypothetical protein
MQLSKAHAGLATAIIVCLSVAIVVQHRSQNRLHAEQEDLRQLNENLKTENERLSQPATQANNLTSPTQSPSTELLRLRGEIGVLRRQSEELKASAAAAQKPLQQASPPQEQQPTDAEEYPKSPEAATASIFETLMQADLEKFVRNFGEPGVPKEAYDKIFGQDRVKGYFAQIDSVTLGQPTNSFGPNMWFVPYTLHFKDGQEKELRLHVAQDPRSQKWYFKGGI